MESGFIIFIYKKGCHQARRINQATAKIKRVNPWSWHPGHALIPDASELLKNT
jgi:hypothetical protein